MRVEKATADYPRSASRRPRDAIGSPSTGSAPKRNLSIIVRHHAVPWIMLLIPLYGPIIPILIPPNGPKSHGAKLGGFPLLFLVWNMIVRIMPVKQPSKRWPLPALVSPILDGVLPICLQPPDLESL